VLLVLLHAFLSVLQEPIQVDELAYHVHLENIHCLEVHVLINVHQEHILVERRNVRIVLQENISHHLDNHLVLLAQQVNIQELEHQAVQNVLLVNIHQVQGQVVVNNVQLVRLQRLDLQVVQIVQKVHIQVLELDYVSVVQQENINLILNQHHALLVLQENILL
jgi:hypothetical protein